MIGAAPPPEQAETADALRYADAVAGVASRAAEHFNKALRTYYFGLAALSWFLQPYLFMALAALVVIVVYRREFHSHTMRILGPVGETIPPPQLSARAAGPAPWPRNR